MLRDDPDDGAAAAMLGGHLTTVGWKIRSTVRAKYVSHEQFAAFHDWLRKAESGAVDGAARNPQDPAIGVARLPTARGLGLGRSEARRRYDRLAAVDPHHLPGQRHLLQQLCPKWGGTLGGSCTPSRREAMLAAPPGAHSAVLVAEAHIEHWLDLDSDAAARYLRSPDVLGRGLRRGPALRAGTRIFARSFGWVRAMSTFAMVFSRAGEQTAAGSLFAVLGHFASEWPWIYLGDPVAQVRAGRAAAVLPAGASR